MSTPPPILAATDFSAAAERALHRAANLARELERPLHLLHVCNEFTWSSLRTLLAQPPGFDLRADLAARLRAAAEALAAPGAPAADSTVLLGRAAAGIIARAREIEAGLVVLGAHGEGLASELALGGTAIKVLRASPCPVLVARGDPQRPYRRVLVGTDFSAASSRALRAALEWFPAASLGVAHALGATHAERLRHLPAVAQRDAALHLEREREAAARNLAAFVADADYRAALDIDSILREGYAAGVLLEEAAHTGADLLVVGRHGRSALDERLLGSVALNLLHHAPCDVLLVP